MKKWKSGKVGRRGTSEEIQRGEDGGKVAVKAKKGKKE